mmetsp:Transcript_50763/g.75233  ORF Transcript_50763/g.75233 Transcript_50763/m.75233 type:complete len:136 (+) Transcript_50763:168-575(+)
MTVFGKSDLGSPIIDTPQGNIPIARVVGADVPMQPTQLDAKVQADTATQKPSGAAGTVYENLGRSPCQLKCPHCHEEMVTNVREKVNAVTVGGVIVCFLIFWPLFWLPLVISSCKSTIHTCTNCHREVGETQPCQ